MSPVLRGFVLSLVSAALIAFIWGSTATLDADWALWRRYSFSTAAANIAGTLTVLFLAAGLSSRHGRRGRFVRLFASTLALAVCFTLFELPALAGYDYGRLFGTRLGEAWNQISTGTNRADPELVHIHQPHTRHQGLAFGNLVARLSIPNAEPYQVDVSYDRHGFRNAVDLDRADVVVVGDSFVEGAETPAGQIVTAVLAERLGERVANLGQSGYGPQQEAVVLERFGLPKKPRAVVWFFFGGNDLADAEAYDRFKRDPTSLAPVRPLAERSFARNALWALARLTTPPRRRPSPTSLRHAATFRTAEGRDVTIYFEAIDGPFEARQWASASAALLGARDAAVEIGARFLVVYVPRKFQVYWDVVSSDRDTVARLWQPSDLAARVDAWCRAQKIEFLDATTPLRAAAASGELVYLPDDVHWTARGHRVVGEAVAARLQPARGGD